MNDTSDTEKSLFIFDDQDALLKHLKQILAAAQKEIAIFSHNLEASLFSDSSITSTLSALARSTANAQVRVVVENPIELIERRHQILQLSQRLVSKIHIKKLIIDPFEPYEFIIADRDKLWLRHEQDGFNGFANYAAGPEVKRFLPLFEEYWKNSEVDVSLRRLSL